MKCPECNHQNPDNATICEKCYLNFSTIRTSKLAISSLILGISSLLLFVITGLPAIIFGIISILKIRKSHGQLKGNGLAKAGIITSLLLMIALFLLWRVDAPPIPDDYSMADLRSAPVEYEESYHILVKLLNLFKDDYRLKDANEPLLTREDRTIFDKIIRTSEKGTDTELADLLNENADTINMAWDKTQKARDIIHRLNEFPEIADLTSYKKYPKSLKLSCLYGLTNLYYVYSMFQHTQNSIDNLTNELIALDSILKKMCPNIRNIGSKLECYGSMDNNIIIANNIANKPETSLKTIELFEQHFMPMKEHDLLLKNCFIFEYIYMKNILQDVYNKGSWAVKLTLKLNSSLRLYRNHCNEFIRLLEENDNPKSQTLKVCPSFYHFREPVISQANGYLPLIYRIYNSTGSEALQIISLKDAFTHTLKLENQLRRHNELIQIVLSKRLGKDLDLSTLAYGDEYIIDIENKKIFSPGPDGIKDTKDDITLPINPEVLHLSE